MKATEVPWIITNPLHVSDTPVTLLIYYFDVVYLLLLWMTAVTNMSCRSWAAVPIHWRGQIPQFTNWVAIMFFKNCTSRCLVVLEHIFLWVFVGGERVNRKTCGICRVQQRRQNAGDRNLNTFPRGAEVKWWVVSLSN